MPQIGEKAWKVKRMKHTYARTPFIVVNPECPPGRHPTRDCGCRVFKSEKKADEYAAARNGS